MYFQVTALCFRVDVIYPLYKDWELNMSKFNCAREYRLSKRRYDEMFVFRHGDGSQRTDSGLRLISVLVVVLVSGLLLMGFWA